VRTVSDQPDHSSAPERGEPVEGPRQVGAVADEAAEDRGVLQRLTTTLTQVRPHRVRGVADQHDWSGRPRAPGGAVIDVVALHDSRVGSAQHRWDRLRPEYLPRR